MRETQKSAYHHFRSINISIAIQHIGASHSTLDILDSPCVNITTRTVFLLHLVFKPAYNHWDSPLQLIFATRLHYIPLLGPEHFSKHIPYKSPVEETMTLNLTPFGPQKKLYSLIAISSKYIPFLHLSLYNSSLIAFHNFTFLFSLVLTFNTNRRVILLTKFLQFMINWNRINILWDEVVLHLLWAIPLEEFLQSARITVGFLCGMVTVTLNFAHFELSDSIVKFYFYFYFYSVGRFNGQKDILDFEELTFSTSFIKPMVDRQNLLLAWYFPLGIVKVWLLLRYTGECIHTPLTFVGKLETAGNRLILRSYFEKHGDSFDQFNFEWLFWYQKGVDLVSSTDPLNCCSLPSYDHILFFQLAEDRLSVFLFLILLFVISS